MISLLFLFILPLKTSPVLGKVLLSALFYIE